jgi:thiamine kinase-like enzyme
VRQRGSKGTEQTASLKNARHHDDVTEEDCKGLLDLVCSSKDGELRDMGFEPLTAGFANHVWAIKTKGRELVIKCYTDLAFLRLDPEAIGSVDVIAGESGIGPQVLHASRRGLVMERVAGHTLEEKEMHEDNFGLLENVANAVAHLHKLTVPAVCKGPPMLWRSVDKTVDVAGKRPELWPVGMPSIEAVKKEIGRAKEALNRMSPRIVLSHGDLKPSNVISDENNGEVHLIDCELGGPNYRAFDLMKIFRTAAEASNRSMRHFVRMYAEKIDGSASEASIQKLLAEAKMFEPLTWLEASCFFLAMPQFKPAETNTWHALAVDRWNKYEETKHLLFAAA